MLKSKFATKLLIACVCFCFILFLVFVSLLGENNKVHDDVKNFIQNILSKNYSAALQSYSVKAIEKQKSFTEARKFHFTLGLAMFEYFGLMENPDYSIEIERENMWIPFITPNELKVSVNLTPQKESTLMPHLFNKPKQKLLKEFITLTREDGKWKISKIYIEGSELEGIFKRIQSNIIVGKYINITPKGFVLKETKFDIEKFSPLERKVLAQDLQAALEVLDKSSMVLK